MGTSFYGVLGVGPDADERAIRAGYRERVKSVHPDVNDDPNADTQFKRLKTAKETLIDAEERARYDRLGHASYVREHVDCAAWTASGKSTESDSTTDCDSPKTTGGEATDDAKSSEGSSPTSASNDGDSRSVRAGAAPGRTTGQHGDSTGGGSKSSSRTHSRQTPYRARSSTSYAVSSFWQGQAADSGRTMGSTHTASHLLRFLRTVRTLGPWLVVHLAFLTVAIGTALYVYAVVLDGSPASTPLLFLLVGEVGLALGLSSVHVLTRLSR